MAHSQIFDICCAYVDNPNIVYYVFESMMNPKMLIVYQKISDEVFMDTDVHDGVSFYYPKTLKIINIINMDDPLQYIEQIPFSPNYKIGNFVESNELHVLVYVKYVEQALTL